MKTKKTVLVTLNSKYIHSSLALRSLKAYCKDSYADIAILEFTINDPIDKVVSALAAQHPDLLCFSCYIWNIRMTLDVIDTIKKILPDCRVLLGGPEVSYDSEEMMVQNSFIDYIVVGEGEETFREFLDCLHGRGSISDVKGLVWRKDGNIIKNPSREPILLYSIPFAYSDGLTGLDDRIIYYESSRGCPYRCQYCLSSITGPVRFLSIERVKEELAYFVKSGVKQVKFVDRTFNCNPGRAKEIFRYLINLNGSTNFHFEMAGDLIDNEMMDILAQAPPGMFQFEIGVQSTAEATLTAISRKTDISGIEKAVRKLVNNDNIHIHLDLIAGLPEEDINSMACSINRVLGMSPHRLQLGFLKMLKGSGLRNAASIYAYSYTSYPPYEVLSNHVLSYNDIARLKQIEELVELYYNSHCFDRSLEYLIQQREGDYYGIFDSMAEYWDKNGYFRYSHSNIRLYEHLLEYAESFEDIDMRLFKELLRFDYAMKEKPGRYPKGIEPVEDKALYRHMQDVLMKDEALVKQLKGCEGYTPKQILRRLHLEVFNYRMDLNGSDAYAEGRTAAVFNYMNRRGVLKRPQILHFTI
ncbi:MAG TPA: B12-binding domain-containing radical SAM protein [Clostridiales bacterium]|nr:B12-binding domain-containing radical SAM protein [Clostridiales bacterium]